MKKFYFLFLFCSIAAVSFVSCTKSTSETSYDKKSYVEICGLKWVTKNVGATEDNPYGNYYTYEQALVACPDGWRLPISDELEQLSQFHSIPVIYNGMHGIWFSGSTPYKDGIDAVFLPMAGYEYEGAVVFLGYYGYYWASTVAEDFYAYDLGFSSSELGMCLGYRGEEQHSVRCVKD